MPMDVNSVILSYWTKKNYKIKYTLVVVLALVLVNYVGFQPEEFLFDCPCMSIKHFKSTYVYISKYQEVSKIIKI